LHQRDRGAAVTMRLVVGLVVLAGIGAAVVVVTGWGNRARSDRPAYLPLTDSPPASSMSVDDAAAQIARLAARQDPAAASELITLYGKLASNAGALDARKAAFHALLGQSDVRVGLAAALAAIASDPAPRAQDPMWPYVVQEIGRVWDGVTLQHGRDLAMLEERPKPRDVLIESLAQVPPGRLSETQRASLAADLIDLYPRLRAEQRPAIDRELVALGGTDLVEILGRRGLAEDNYLKGAIEERRAQEAARNALGVQVPAR
jgi:hypothetical protein